MREDDSFIALLTHLTGDPHLVTTIEIDSVLAEQATRTLQHIVGNGVSVRGRGNRAFAEEERRRYMER